MKILNVWMITISLLQLHVCYGSSDNVSSHDQIEAYNPPFATSVVENLKKMIEGCSNNNLEQEKEYKKLETRINDLLGDLDKQDVEVESLKKKIEDLEHERAQASQLTKELESTLSCNEASYQINLSKLQKDNELLSWPETLALNARHIWAAATTASAVACAGTSYLLSKADTKSSPVLAAAAGGTGLFTLAGIFMTGKKHYVYNQAFKAAKLESITTPAEQRQLLKNIQALDGKTSVTSWIFYPSQQNNN